MTTKREISSVSPPSHLSSIDWNNSIHRTGVASCLVHAVYKLEIDRQNKKVGPESQAKRWLEFFKFTLLEKLYDNSDSSIHGAIFQYNSSHHYNDQNIPGLRPPRYVIAFRGTILTWKTWFRDLKNDIRCSFDTLHGSKRAMHAMEAIHTLVVKHGDTSVWLAGHDLGASIALLTGKTMARSGFFLESYIFNPTISAISLDELSESKMLKGGFRAAKAIFKDLEAQEDDASMNIASWTPYLYVNPVDSLCSEYIDYFKNKTVMSKNGLSELEKIAAKDPLIRSLFIGQEGTSSPSDLSNEPFHFLPSAYMTVNTSGSHDIEESHELPQWWHPSFKDESVLYQSKPKGLSEDVWLAFQKYWQQPETNKTSETNSANLTTQPGEQPIYVHNFGPTSFKQAAMDMTIIDSGIDSDLIAVVEKTHTNNKTGRIQDPLIAYFIGIMKKKRDDRVIQPSESKDDSSSPTNISLAREKINQMKHLPQKERPRVLDGLVSNENSTSTPFPSDPHLEEKIRALEEKIVERDNEIRSLKEKNTQILS